MQYHLGCTANQQWRVTLESDGYYSLTPVFDTSKRLDVTNGSATNGTNIQVAANNGTAAQRFRITAVGGNYYKIQSKLDTNKVVEVVSASTADSANVQLYDYVGQQQQMWYIQLAYGLVEMDGFGWNPNLVNRISMPSSSYMAAKKINPTPTEALNILRGSSIFASYSHGSPTAIQLNGGYLTREDILALPAGALSSCDLVIYVACYTGSQSANLVNATYSRGARTVIGFQQEIPSYAAGEFFEYFLGYINQGETINGAYDKAYADITSDGTHPVPALMKENATIRGSLDPIF